VRTAGEGLDLGTVLCVQDLVQRNMSAGPIVIAAPPECIPELAHALGCLLDVQLRSKRVPCVLTCGPGSLPDGSCVPTNIQEAVQVRRACCPALRIPNQTHKRSVIIKHCEVCRNLRGAETA